MEPTRRMTVASADGTLIAVWITGVGPTLLAVPGTAADHTAWDRVVPLLAPHATVAVVDRRGRGESGDVEPYRIGLEVDDLVAVAAALPGPVHLYGHSFGGYLALHAAPRVPNLASLALYEGGLLPRGVQLFSASFIAELDRLVSAGLREQALDLFMPHAAGLRTSELAALRAQPNWQGRLRSAHTIPRELRSLAEHGADPVPTEQIAVPVLLIVGAETKAMRRSWFESMAGLFADARVAVLPRQGHAAHMTAPELLAGALAEFVGTGTAATAR